MAHRRGKVKTEAVPHAHVEQTKDFFAAVGQAFMGESGSGANQAFQKYSRQKSALLKGKVCRRGGRFESIEYY
jgi:hypothetical protein